MMKTFKKEIKWREEKDSIFICDCKLLRDLFLPKKYLDFIIRFHSGILENELNRKEIKVLNDFKRLNMVGNLHIGPISGNFFKKATQILDNELGAERVRDNDFLYKKFKEYPEFFLGIFLDDELIGVVFGFPREDYLLMSELAIDRRFQRRGFGGLLVKEFEKVAKERKHHKINVGSDDKAINFYSSLDYKPFLLVQYGKDVYFAEEFKLPIMRKGNREEDFVELKIRQFSANILKNLRRRFPKAYFQYIFTKEI